MLNLRVGSLQRILMVRCQHVGQTYRDKPSWPLSPAQSRIEKGKFGYMLKLRVGQNVFTVRCQHVRQTFPDKRLRRLSTAMS